MNLQEIKTAIIQELPHLIQTDEEIRQFIIYLGRERFADKNESDRRFDLMINALEEQNRQSSKKWEEHLKQFDEHLKQFDQFQQEQARKWEEQRKESETFRQEQARKWDENVRIWNETQSEIRKLSKKYESTIGALGSRWGLSTQSSLSAMP